MKKLLILITVFLFAFQISNAQTEKGSQTIGLDAGVSYYKSNTFTVNPFDGSSSNIDTKTTNLTFGPSYSYFIADKLDIGASLSLSSTKTTNDDILNSNPAKQNSYGYGGSIYLRKYIMYQNKIGIRVGPYLSYVKTDYKSIYNGSNSIYSEDSKTDNYNAGANLALVYYPSQHLGVSAIIANLGYSHYKTDSGTQGHADGDSLNFSFVNSLALSVFYTFGSR